MIIVFKFKWTYLINILRRDVIQNKTKGQRKVFSFFVFSCNHQNTTSCNLKNLQIHIQGNLPSSVQMVVNDFWIWGSFSSSPFSSSSTFHFNCSCPSSSYPFTLSNFWYLSIDKWFRDQRDFLILIENWTCHHSHHSHHIKIESWKESRSWSNLEI